MKTKLLLSIILCVFTLNVGAKDLSIKDLQDSLYVWTKDQVEIERVSLGLSGATFSKNYTKISTDDIDWYVEIRTDASRKKVNRMSMSMKTRDYGEIKEVMELCADGLINKSFNVLRKNISSYDTSANVIFRSKENQMICIVNLSTLSYESTMFTFSISFFGLEESKSFR